MTVGSFGSKTARRTLRAGRSAVMSGNTTPEGASTEAARGFVETKTWLPTATSTLLLFDGATSACPGPGKGPTMRHVLLPSWLCQRFSLPLTYTTPAALGSVPIGAR